MKWISALAVLFFCVSLSVGQKMSDRDFDGLKGKAKVVEEWSQEISPGKSNPEHDADTEYDEAGNEVSSTLYSLGERKIYFFLDGAKVSRSEKFSEGSSKIQRLTAIAGPEAEAEEKKADRRYEDRYEYKYTDSFRTIENRYSNKGKLQMSVEYRYDKENLVSVIRKHDGRVTSKDSSKYDSNGLLMQTLSLGYDQNGDEAVNLSYKYSDYKLDSSGNWIERKMSVSHPKDPSDPPTVYLEKRKIIYF